jgi:hypothetical protein
MIDIVAGIKTNGNEYQSAFNLYMFPSGGYVIRIYKGCYLQYEEKRTGGYIKIAQAAVEKRTGFGFVFDKSH